MDHDLSPYFGCLGRRGQPMPLTPPAWGEAEAIKGLRDCVGPLERRRLHERRSNPITLLVDDEIKVLEADGHSRVVVKAGASAGPRSRAVIPWQMG